MSANKKTVRKGFDYLHCDDFAAYLGEMARQGWHFRKFSAGLVFEKGEPEDAVYAVEVFIDGTEYDTRPEPHTKEFAEYCEAAGWQLIDAQRKFCVFKKVREDALDILTPEERLANIAKEEQKKIWAQFGIAAAWTVMNLVDFQMVSFARHIFSNSSLMVTALWLLFFLTGLFRCIHFYIWKYMTRRKIAQGQPIYFGKGKKAGLVFYSWYSIAGLMGFAMYMYGCFYFGQSQMVVYFFVYLVIVYVMGFLIGKFRPDANTNALIQTIVPAVIFLSIMVFSLWQVYNSDAKKQDASQIPLYAQDIGLEWGPLESTSGYTMSSVFGTYMVYYLHYEGNYFYYIACQTTHDWILDRLWDIETEGTPNQIRTDCASEWDAEVGFRSDYGNYFLRYPDGILIFYSYDKTVLTPEQIETIREKLELR